MLLVTAVEWQLQQKAPSCWPREEFHSSPSSNVHTEMKHLYLSSWSSLDRGRLAYSEPFLPSPASTSVVMVTHSLSLQFHFKELLCLRPSEKSAFWVSTSGWWLLLSAFSIPEDHKTRGKPRIEPYQRNTEAPVALALHVYKVDWRGRCSMGTRDMLPR